MKFVLLAALLLIAGCGSSQELTTVTPAESTYTAPAPRPLPVGDAPENIVAKLEDSRTWHELVTLHDDYAERMGDLSDSYPDDKSNAVSKQHYMAEKCRERTVLCNQLRTQLWKMDPRYGIEEYIWDAQEFPLPKIVYFHPIEHSDTR